MTPEWIRSKDRQVIVGIPRQIAIYFCRRSCGLTIEQVGKAFNRHHATVLHSFDKITELIPIDKDIATMVRMVYEELGMAPPDTATEPVFLSTIAKELSDIRDATSEKAVLTGATKRQIGIYRRRVYAMHSGKIHMADCGCRVITQGLAYRVVSREAFEEAYIEGSMPLCFYCTNKYIGDGIALPVVRYAKDEPIGYARPDCRKTLIRKGSSMDY